MMLTAMWTTRGKCCRNAGTDFAVSPRVGCRRAALAQPCLPFEVPIRKSAELTTFMSKIFVDAGVLQRGQNFAAVFPVAAPIVIPSTKPRV
jgi:hypothetical protein